MRASSHVPLPGELKHSFVAGVLALQGDFHLHESAFARAGVSAVPVKTEAELEGVDCLAMPGGESTTLLRLLHHTGLRPALERFVASKPVLGTCAGLILLARELTGGGRVPYPPLGTLDIEVERNAYGRQIDSFEDEVTWDAHDGVTVPGVFIRAPRIRSVGADVEVVATHAGEPVGVRQGKVLGLTFHPELTEDARVHQYFLAECCGLPLD